MSISTPGISAPAAPRPLPKLAILLLLYVAVVQAQEITLNLTGVQVSTVPGNLVVGPDCTMATPTPAGTGAGPYTLALNVTCNNGVTATGQFQVTLGAAEVTGQATSNFEFS